ncbi:hypothetical protein G3I31_04410 [Streptomyces sp. SID9913]|uniref:hypothetical protein n=1 Tax=Streptomyces sp. SID9913 TaxID=2706117 RepID=UPI0013DCCD91|nr:hypothetical protein [Streptomyces sp. SID9913]NED17409.1 hypothetical protein [Streptomyces sp. SID9913]
MEHAELNGTELNSTQAGPLSPFDDPLAQVGSAAAHVAASLSRLSGVGVRVTAVWPHDDSDLRAQGASLLGMPLERDYAEAAVDFSIRGEVVRVFVNAQQGFVGLAGQLAHAVLDSGQEIMGSTPFPPCPGHAHPMTVGASAGRVFWCCPGAPDTATAVLVESGRAGHRRSSEWPSGSASG